MNNMTSRTSNPTFDTIAGLGVDIVEIERFKNAMIKHPKMVNRLFTEQERSYCLNQKNPHLHFAVRFAAKEAVLKALETGRNGIGWKDIEVNREKSGKPQIEMYNNAVKLTKSEGIRKVLITLSFSHNNAIAVAIAIKRESVGKTY